MSSLADFQRRFAGAVLGRHPPEAAFTSPGFAIYRNTWVKALLDALDANFPTVAMLLGTNLFERLAVRYVRAHPARTPALACYGEDFPKFLSSQEAGGEIPYLCDVAELDRLWTEALFAPDANPADPQMATSLSPEELLAFRPSLHPAVRLGWFTTPAVTIWQAHRNGFEELEPEWRPEGALVVRTGGTVKMSLIDEATYGFVEELRHGISLGAAADRMLTRHPTADAAQLLATILSSGALSRPTHRRERKDNGYDNA